MQGKIAIVDETTIQQLINQQQQILNMLQKNSDSSDELLSVKEAAKLLKCSEQKIRQMIDEEQIAHKKFGRTIRIYRSSLI
jgi:excisionase family DNA binding protein